jgi:hypothetical protein
MYPTMHLLNYSECKNNIKKKSNFQPSIYKDLHKISCFLIYIQIITIYNTPRKTRNHLHSFK